MLYTHMTDEALVVGARNILYKLSVDELRLKQTLTWNSIELDRESCLVKGTVLLDVFTRFYCQENYLMLCTTRTEKISIMTCTLINALAGALIGFSIDGVPCTFSLLDCSYI